MTIETNKHRFTIDIDPLLVLIFLGDKVDKKIVSDLAAPDFLVVVRPSNRPDCSSKEGDYSVIIRKDDGKEITLDMPHRGAKMFYVLTLLCQKAVGGLPNKYFTNTRAAAAIKALYDKLYRSGGEQWVANCAANNHNLSTFRTHAKSAVEDNVALDNVLRYWCGFEGEKRTVGKNQIQLRRIRIPNDRIIFEDASHSRITFEEIMEQLPPLDDLFGFRNNITERIRQLHSQKPVSNFPHS